jgi:single-strand DNA-binding protein
MRGVVTGNVGKIFKAERVGENFLLSFSVAEKVWAGTQKGEIACWHSCEIWGKRAESLSQYLTVGQHVDVFGQGYMEEYQSNGETRSKMVVKANEVILGTKPTGGNTQTSVTSTPSGSTPSGPPMPPMDKIPF